MEALSEGIRKLIEAGTTFVLATDLFVSVVPPNPLNCITVFNTSSQKPNTLLKGETTYYRESFQIIIRNESYLEANDISYTLIGLLHMKSNFTLNDAHYLLIQMLNGPNDLNTSNDGISTKRGATLISINFSVQRNEVF